MVRSRPQANDRHVHAKHTTEGTGSQPLQPTSAANDTPRMQCAPSGKICELGAVCSRHHGGTGLRLCGGACKLGVRPIFSRIPCDAAKTTRATRVGTNKARQANLVLLACNKLFSLASRTSRSVVRPKLGYGTHKDSSRRSLPLALKLYCTRSHASLSLTCRNSVYGTRSQEQNV